MRVVCIDDEQLALRYIERQLAKIAEVEVIGSFVNPLEGKEFILREKPDVVFLDIDMTPVNGMEIAEKILEKLPDVILVFVTAYEAYAVNAFELNATDYIVKPLKFERLELTVNRIKNQLQNQHKRIITYPQSLRIKMTPSLAFETEPDVFEPLPWRTAKTQELFIFLLQNHDVVIEKSAIIELLWDDYDLEKAYSLLYTTIYNIRKQIKPYQKHIMLHNHSYGYLLELTQVEIDYVEWSKAIGALPDLTADTVGDYERAMEMYAGTYLANYDYTWLEAERQRYERIWLQASNQIATFYYHNGKVNDAIRWYNYMIDHNPTIEDAHFELMKLHGENGNFAAMMQQYTALHKVWRNYYDAKPSDYIIEWYMEMMK
ncbi:response regulator [Oceanobacillus alkalisoli]|uniref:response regulator n=1 Tax=Oceanobacillus alkalisoli TaxID=2925113 RepID=UPI001EE3FF48|nr:response regulator [Oceanobacillus alkalisoli]MCG5102102.1 response regulator [Oceanobacillus alkalisoli]